MKAFDGNSLQCTVHHLSSWKAWCSQDMRETTDDCFTQDDHLSSGVVGDCYAFSELKIFELHFRRYQYWRIWRVGYASLIFNAEVLRWISVDAKCHCKLKDGLNQRPERNSVREYFQRKAPGLHYLQFKGASSQKNVLELKTVTHAGASKGNSLFTVQTLPVSGLLDSSKAMKIKNDGDARLYSSYSHCTCQRILRLSTYWLIIRSTNANNFDLINNSVYQCKQLSRGINGLRTLPNLLLQ